MNTPARNHHYLPQTYLAAFTDTGTKDGKFYVFDIRSGNRFRTSPKNVAVERDFNRVDLEGKSPDFLEKDLSSFEGQVGQAIRKVNRTKTFPNDEDVNFVLNLLCLIVLRNPRFRREINRFRQAVSEHFAHRLVSNEKLWEHQLEKLQKAGVVGETNVTFEEMKQFVESEEYQIEFTPADSPAVELRAFDELLPIFGERYWSLLIAPASGPDFICSDYPIALTWKKPGRHGPIGYGVENTELFFPLGPKTGFYGVYEDPLSAVVEIKDEHVAMMNSRIRRRTDRHIFSTTDNPIFDHVE